MGEHDHRAKNGFASSICQWLAFAGACLLVEVIQEAMIARGGFALWPWIEKFIHWILGSVTLVSLIGILIQVIPDDKRKSIFKRIAEEKCEQFWPRFWALAKKFFRRYIAHNTVVILALVLLVFACVPAFAAYKGVSRGISELLFPTESTNNESEKESGGDLGEPVKPDSEVQPEHTVNSPKDEASNAPPTEPQDNKTETFFDRFVFTTQMPYSLSDEEKSTIYFMSGDFAITNWEDEEIIQATVKDFVKDQRGKWLDSTFTEDDAGNEIKNKIDYASGVEANMLNDSKPTSGMLEETMDIRMEVYENNKFYCLACLIRENFGRYGDVYKARSKSHNETAILYGKSIIFGFDTLEFDVSQKEYKNNLAILSERYSKLGSILEKDSWQYDVARKLSAAFQGMADDLT